MQKNNPKLHDADGRTELSAPIGGLQFFSEGQRPKSMWGEEHQGRGKIKINGH